MQDPRILSGIIASAWNISSGLEALSREIPVLFQYFVKSTLVDNRGTFGDHEPDAFQRGHAPLAVWQAEGGGESIAHRRADCRDLRGLEHRSCTAE